MKIRTYAIDIDGVICKTYKSDENHLRPHRRDVKVSVRVGYS